MTESRYARNHPVVLDETIDGEVVVIDLATGNYYSLVDSAAFIWGTLTGYPTASGVADALVGAYGIDPAEAAAVADAFLAELVAEGLAKVADDESGEPPTASEPAAVVAGGAFTPPRVEKFDDMQELILLDPVHDVDQEIGWPQPRAID